MYTDRETGKLVPSIDEVMLALRRLSEPGDLRHLRVKVEPKESVPVDPAATMSRTGLALPVIELRAQLVVTSDGRRVRSWLVESMPVFHL